MLEIIALIFLCRSIGNTAERKGLKPLQWKIITVATWIGFEFAGAMLGIILFGFDKNNLIGLELFAVACAFGGYLLVKLSLDRKEDKSLNDDIDNIGS